MGYRDYGFWFV